MKTIIVIAGLACLVVIAGCGDSESRSRKQTMQNQPSPKPWRPPTPEEVLGIEMPGRLAASVEAWAGSNALGEYFKQSRDRLAELHAQLIEDYNVRMESELAPTDFTRETLRKYHEAFEADSILRQFMVECYSRKDVSPLPQSIADRFSTKIDIRERMRKVIDDTPGEIARLNKELVSMKSEMDSAGTSTWAQEKDLQNWRNLQIRVGGISTRANKASADVSVLAANMAEALAECRENEDVDRLYRHTEQLKSNVLSFAVHVAKQLEIVNGQILLTRFADDCKAMAESTITVPAVLAKKKARQAEIKELINRIISSRTRDYSDLNMLADQTAAIKVRSRSEGERETELGKRVRELAGNYEQVFGSSAIYRLKQDLPDLAARARVDSNLEAFKRAMKIPQGVDLEGMFTGIESKAYQLADRMEEEAMLKRLDETLLTVQRFAARRR